MAKAKQQLSGKYLNSVVITPLKDASDGTLSTGDVVGAQTLVDGPTFVGFIEEIEFDREYETEDATMLGQDHAGEVSGVRRITCTMTEILRYANGNLLQKAFDAKNTMSDGEDEPSRIALVKIARGGLTFTFYANMRSYRETFRKGKCLGVMVLSGIDPVALIGYNDPATVATTGTGQNPNITSYSQSSFP